MDVSPNRTFQVNELTPDPNVAFDPKVAKSYVTYAHRLAARGLVNSSVGRHGDPRGPFPTIRTASAMPSRKASAWRRSRQRIW